MDSIYDERTCLGDLGCEFLGFGVDAGAGAGAGAFAVAGAEVGAGAADVSGGALMIAG